MRKLILCITLLLLLSANAFAAEHTDENNIRLLSSMSIMQGDGASFNGDELLTREQLAKIAVFVTEPHFSGKSRVSPYSDVPYTKWSAPYIERASEKGYFSGYPDGSFHPETAVTIEELCKVMLNFLRYNYTETYGGWSDAQMIAANDLGLLDGAAIAAGTPVTRNNAARIIVNTLLTQKSSGGYLIEDAGYGYYRDTVLIAIKDTGYITTSADTFEKGIITDDDISRKGSIVTDKSGMIVVFFPTEQLSENYAVKKLFPDHMELYNKNGSMISLNIDPNTMVYNNAEGKSYIQVYSNIIAGTDLYIFRNNIGDIDYITLDDISTNVEYDCIVKSTIQNGITAFGHEGDEFVEIEGDTTVYEGSTTSIFSQIRDNLEIGDKLTVYRNSIGGIKYIYLTKDAISPPGHINEFNISSDTKIIIDGKKKTKSDLNPLDICYYISETDTLLVYTKRITGIYERALPTKDNIKSVQVSGKEYAIGGENALRKLSSYGDISYGDAVTLMFGKDDSLVDVTIPEEHSEIIGYLENCILTEKEDEDGNKISVYTSFVLLPDGTTNEYTSDKNYSGYECKAVKVAFADGKARLTALGANRTVSGTYNREHGTMGKYIISDDVEIIDTMKNTYYNQTTHGIGKKIFPQRLDGANLSSENILYANVINNRITRLILNDYTGDIYDYGVILKAENKSSDYFLSGSYELNINGEYKNFTTSDSTFSIHNGDVIRYLEEDGKPLVMQPIGKYNERIDAVDEIYAYIGERKYRLSDDIVIYRKVADTESPVSRRYEVISKKQIRKFAK